MYFQKIPNFGPIVKTSSSSITTATVATIKNTFSSISDKTLSFFTFVDINDTNNLKLFNGGSSGEEIQIILGSYINNNVNDDNSRLLISNIINHIFISISTFVINIISNSLFFLKVPLNFCNSIYKMTMITTNTIWIHFIQFFQCGCIIPMLTLFEKMMSNNNNDNNILLLSKKNINVIANLYNHLSCLLLHLKNSLQNNNNNNEMYNNMINNIISGKFSSIIILPFLKICQVMMHQMNIISKMGVMFKKISSSTIMNSLYYYNNSSKEVIYHNIKFFSQHIKNHYTISKLCKIQTSIIDISLPLSTHLNEKFVSHIGRFTLIFLKGMNKIMNLNHHHPNYNFYREQQMGKSYNNNNNNDYSEFLKSFSFSSSDSSSLSSSFSRFFEGIVKKTRENSMIGFLSTDNVSSIFPKKPLDFDFSFMKEDNNIFIMIIVGCFFIYIVIYYYYSAIIVDKKDQDQDQMKYVHDIEKELLQVKKEIMELNKNYNNNLILKDEHQNKRSSNSSTSSSSVTTDRDSIRIRRSGGGNKNEIPFTRDDDELLNEKLKNADEKEMKLIQLLEGTNATLKKVIEDNANNKSNNNKSNNNNNDDDGDNNDDSNNDDSNNDNNKSIFQKIVSANRAKKRVTSAVKQEQKNNVILEERLKLIENKNKMLNDEKEKTQQSLNNELNILRQELIRKNQYVTFLKQKVHTKTAIKNSTTIPITTNSNNNKSKNAWYQLIDFNNNKDNDIEEKEDDDGDHTNQGDPFSDVDSLSSNKESINSNDSYNNSNNDMSEIDILGLSRQRLANTKATFSSTLASSTSGIGNSMNANSKPFSVTIKSNSYFLKSEDILPSSEPLKELDRITRISEISGSNWLELYRCINSVRRLVLHHSIICEKVIPSVMPCILKEIDNTRLQVSKNCILCIGDIFIGLGRKSSILDSQLNSIIQKLVFKIGNEEISEVSIAVMELILVHISKVKILQVLLGSSFYERMDTIQREENKDKAIIIEKVRAKLIFRAFYKVERESLKETIVEKLEKISQVYLHHDDIDIVEIGTKIKNKLNTT